MTAVFNLLRRNQLAVIGCAILGAIIALAIVTPFLPLLPPNETDTASRFLHPFTVRHLLGTDHLGRDILSRLLWGMRVSLIVGFAAAIIAGLIGSAIGLFTGFYGGQIDNAVMRLIDMLMAFPYILLALAIVAVLGPGLVNAVIAVVIVNIPFFARNIRGATLSIAHREFIDAARLAGMGNIRIIVTEVLPNVLPTIVIAMSTTIGWMILETAGLSFLGLGSQPPHADLGSMLGEARSAIITEPHTSIIPGIMIFLIVISVNLLGDGIRDALDPRLRSGILTRPLAVTRDDRKTAPTPQGNELLQIYNLVTEFAGKGKSSRAVNDVSLHLDHGECLGIIGESGSGKTVTALSVMGLVASPPGSITGGAVWLEGHDLVGAPYEFLRDIRGRRVSYIFQDPLSTLHPLYRIGDQIAETILVHATVSRSEAMKRAIQLLGDVKLPNPEVRARAFPHQLSGGMRQRVGIAMALANKPDIIIADEPTTALDVTVQSQILSLLKELRHSRKLSIIFITHDVGIVAQLCDRVAVMYAGQIVEIGATHEVLKSPRHPYAKRLIECVPKLGSRNRLFKAIPGLPPSLSDLPEGCAFSPRCDKAQPECRIGRIKISEGIRPVRCLYPESV
ncbi:MAG: dipeptide/oligopeptide/nickel ABC transporter permease/ATP-binding protein [Hyphomicrobiales bacterium]|nr:dipeptide/oligopeptide/nickel ABC transporter permease/ATP-binding protein [Hyphomicrobiales bacterium]